MKSRLPAILLCLFALFLGCVAAQTEKTPAPAAAPPAASPTASPSPTPARMPTPQPDQKAYDEARRIKDPQKKIDALEQLLKDYPDGFAAFQARNEVLDVLIKNFPTQTDRIRAAAERYLRPMDFIVFGGGSNHVTVAVKLMDAGILLDWAEELAKKGAAQSEEETAKTLRRQRARSNDALGRIYLKQGKTKLAKNYLKQALANDGELVTTLVALGQIAEASGDHKAALEYLASAAVRSTLKKADRERLESAYRARHDGSLTGLEELLDDKYRKLNAVVSFAHYQPSPKRTNRVALAELFTGSGCGPCVAADLGFDGLLERYDRKDLVVLVYHLHIPLPDPMTNPAAVERGKYYAVPGTPTPILDGFKLPSAGGSREMTKGFFERVNPKIEAALETPAQAQLTLTGSIQGDQVKTTVTVDDIKAPSPDLKVHIVLAEGDLRYTGENGVRFHPMVVRSMGGKDAAGFAVSGSGPAKAEWTFDLKTMSDELKKYLDTYEQQGHRGDSFTFSEKKYQINPQNLSLVAFVQDMKTKNVLQTVYVKLNPTATASAQTNAR